MAPAVNRVVPTVKHLVVIESGGLEGIPFHVAVAPELTCSYSSSWISLATAIASRRKSVEKLSFAMVPAFADDRKVVVAMQNVRDSLRGFAERVGLAYDEAIGAACDENALSGLLLPATSASSRVTVSFTNKERKWHGCWRQNGGLPGTSGVLVEEDEQAFNHLSWREIERLERTPQIIVSAACSSDRALAAGLGERIGL